MILRNCATSGYCYPEIATKKTCFRKYLRKNENIFENILGGYSRAYVLLIHEKNQSSKISCYCPFKIFELCVYKKSFEPMKNGMEYLTFV